MLEYAGATVPVSDFLNFGPTAGDQVMAKEDDAFTRFNISISFPFFDRIYREAYLTTNGVIYFGAGSTDFVPRPFPLTNITAIASYWTDSDPSRGGNIYYRQIYETTELNRITTEITSKIIKHRKFICRWALMMTYESVSAYGCDAVGSISNCPSSCTGQTLTYQTVLASDGINSFVIFYYNKLQFTAGIANCSGHAQIGFNAGDGRRFILVNNSNTEQIPNSALNTSNVGSPGTWIYNIDGADIGGILCNFKGLLELHPQKVLHFGGENFYIRGPCFYDDEFIIVTVHTIVIQCSLDGVILQCETPYLDKIGPVKVSLNYNGINYENFIVSVDTGDIKAQNGDYEMDVTSTPDSNFIIRWQPSLIGDSEVLLTLRGFQIDTNLGSGGEIISQNITKIRFEAPNTGSFNFVPNIGFQQSAQFVRRLLIAAWVKGQDTIQFTRTVVRAASSTCSHQCSAWYSRQPSAAQLISIIGEVTSRSPCAPIVPNPFNQLIGYLEFHPQCNPFNPALCDFFHRGATACYRSTNNNGRQAAQCCYTNGMPEAQLALGPTRGGKIDFADSTNLESAHFWQDVAPYLFCCSVDASQCIGYYEKRPPVDSTGYRRPEEGSARTDPHFRTFDGTEYTFNPLGEFIYLTNNEDVIQSRFSQYVNSQGDSTRASYFSSFVVKGKDSAVIQVDLTSAQTFSIRVDGEIMILEPGIWRSSGIVLSYEDNSTLTIRIESGIEITIQILGRMLNGLVSLPIGQKGKIKGLLGNWDDNSANDLELPGGSSISTNSNISDIHFNFGMKWETRNDTSLFFYPEGLSWDNFRQPDFMPDFSPVVLHPSCGNNFECSYDIRVSGDAEVGQANLQLEAESQAREQFYENLESVCLSDVTVANGYVTVQGNNQQVVYNFECNQGFRLHGDAVVTCNAGTYSASFGICVNKNDSQGGNTDVTFVTDVTTKGKNSAPGRFSHCVQIGIIFAVHSAVLMSV